MAGRAGLKKVQKTVRGKHGSVKRSYWVKSNPKQLKNQGPPGQPGFLRRNAGKLALGAAAVGLAVLNRHKIGAAIGAAREMHGRAKAGGWNAATTAHAMFSKAKVGWNGARDQDKTALRLAGAGQNAVDRVRGAGQRARAAVPAARQAVTNYRRTVGADLAGHMTRVGGEAAASHIGSHFGTVAGTALGGFAAGPVGAGVGGFLGGHAGGFLANRHTEKHINRAANWAVDRLRR
jgi:hypothetical protein